MRVFYAIEFSDNIKAKIKSIQAIVKDNSIKGSYSHEENFHLTLKFIGEINDGMLPKLKNSMDRAINDTNNFTLRLDRLGFFSRGNKKIIWLGVKTEGAQLNKLYKNLEAELYETGIPREEKEYSPHITLSRETVLKPSFEEQLKKIEIEPIEVEVSKISLMESTRIAGKLLYRPIYVKNLDK